MASPTAAAAMHPNEGAQPIRPLVAALVAFAGIVHLALGPEHLSESNAIGGAMIAAGVAQLGLAVLVSRGASSTAALLTLVVLNGAVAVAWLAAVTIGLPVESHPHTATAIAGHGSAGHVEPVSVLGLATLAAEVVAVAWAALLRR